MTAALTKMYIYITLFDYHLLRLNILSANQTKHIHAYSSIDAGLGAAVDLLAAEDAARHVDDLHGGAAFVSDNPVAVAIEGEGLSIGS